MRNNNPHIKYIGISAIRSGKRSGKDTLASYIIRELSDMDFFAERRALADPLKSACGDIFGLSWEQMYGNEDEKNGLTSFDWPSNNIYGHSGAMTSREILQFFGSEIMRDGFGPNVWIESLKMYGESRLKEVLPVFNAGLKAPPLYIVVPDIRFPNEADFVDFLIDIYRVDAESSNNDTHISEKSGADFVRNIDFEISNNGSMEELKESAQKMLNILKHKLL